MTPEQAGLPHFGGERRVPGLRREEVAQLAGVSLDYYTRLERGNIRGASESVLNAIARALQLDDVEREHLFDLARPRQGGGTGRETGRRAGAPVGAAGPGQHGGACPGVQRAAGHRRLEPDRPRPQFRKDWADHHVHEHRHGQKVYRHPEVGEIEITFDAFDMPGEPGLMICTYTAEEGTPSAERMALLASWAATQEFGSNPSPQNVQPATPR